MKTPLALVVAALTSACGYQVLHAEQPFGATQVSLVPFAEETPVGLSVQLAQALGRELTTLGVSLTVDERMADAVLSGQVLACQTTLSPTAGAGARVPAYDIRVQIAAALTSRDGRELWQTHMDLSESFLPSLTGSDAALLETEANRRRALMRLADAAAHTIVERLSIASAAAPPAGA